MTLARIAWGLSIAAVLGACTPAQSTSTPAAGTPLATGGPAEPDPKAIFASFKTDPNFVKVNTAPIKSGPHMGDVDIYVDKANAAKFKGMGASAPDGMTVVKQSVQDAQRHYLMKKIKSYDPDNNDWYYANTKADGQVEMTGKPQMCIGCHQGYKATDFLAAPGTDYAKGLLK